MIYLSLIPLIGVIILGTLFLMILFLTYQEEKKSPTPNKKYLKRLSILSLINILVILLSIIYITHFILHYQS